MSDRRDRPMTERAAYKKALKRGTRYRTPKFNAGLAIVITLFVLIIAVCGIVIMKGAHKKADPAVTDTSVTDVTGDDGTGGTAGVGDDPGDTSGTVTVTLPREEVARGNLILVNADHEFVFPDVREDVSVYENKTVSYKVNDLNVTMLPVAIDAFNALMDDFYALTQCRDVMVVSGFRTEEFQRQLYSDRVATDGVEMAAKYVALPGQSEHHTGLAMDLSVYTDAGEGFYVRDYEKCQWLVENFEDYGFILRYPEDKASITGISYESWHYRYVGLPHSLIMEEMGLCFEEYLEYLWRLEDGCAIAYKKADGDGDGADVPDDGTAAEPDATDPTEVCEIIPMEAAADYRDSYLVYYVGAAEEGDTDLPVPEGREYLISGDNAGGFVVTVMPAAE